MDPVQLVKILMVPTATAVVTVGVCVFLVLRHLSKWRQEVLHAVIREVRKDLSGDGVQVKGPVVVSPEDNFVPRSVIEMQNRNTDGRICDLTGRVERLERRLDQDILRLHERVDEMPHRVVELLKPLLLK